MPIQKDFKRLVRARMSKTGESYTAARAQLLTKAEPRTRSTTAPPSSAAAAPAPPPVATDYAALAGMSDKAIEKSTGCTWEKWVWALDRAGADEWSHRAIAEHVHRTYKVREWWTQAVTVGYERIKGLRAIGQRRSGAFEATKSRTIAAPARAITRAFTDSRIRRHWLPDVAVTIRKAVPGKSVRITWDDGTVVEVWLTAKGPKKTIIAIAHTKLEDRDDVNRRKRYWLGRLSALALKLEDL